MNSLRYRADIDGLRAIAVISVVWFHCGLPGLNGGFAGVDIFFVISGYLITRLISADIAEGDFSLKGFYAARLRRIAPALLAMEATVLLVAAISLLPSDFSQFGRSLFPATVGAANFFWWTQTGYFSSASKNIPLLHLWTLGVEEQFYLVYPGALLIATRLRCAKPTIFVSTIMSFCICVFGTRTSPSAAFYLLPMRAWELMLGAFVAVGSPGLSIRTFRTLSTAGLCLIAAGMTMLHRSMSFPGWQAAIPAVGAMLVIMGGPDGSVSKPLASPPLVWIGRRSYSLYLWHWPILVFTRYWLAAGDLPAGWAVTDIAISAGLACASYSWIEQPARDRNIPFRRIAVMLGTGAFLIVGAGFWVVAAKGFPARLSSDIIRTAAERDDLPPLAHACVDIPFSEISSRCHVGQAGRARFLLWGDSHAAAISEGVALGLESSGTVASENTCPPALGWATFATSGPDQRSCKSRNEALARAVVTDPAIHTVLLSAIWGFYEKEGKSSHFWASVQSLVDRLRAAGKRVVVIAGVPEPAADVPRADAVRERLHRPMLKWACPAAKIPIQGVLLVDLSPSFCDERYRTTLFTDSNHPSRTAGLVIVRLAIAKLAADEWYVKSEAGPIRFR